MKTNIKRIVLLGGILLGASVGGCQLIVDFDRTLIDAGTVDASFDVSKPDTQAPDASDGGNTNDASDAATNDASEAATSDASDAATSDASDGSSDATTD